MLGGVMTQDIDAAMGVRINTAPGVTEIRLSGRMTFAEHDRFRHVISAFDGPSGHQMVFDLSDLEFVDSSGLGMLLIARDVAQRKRLDFSLKGVRNEVRRVMTMAKFERIIPILE